MAKVVLDWYKQSGPLAQREFRECSEKDLIGYHSTLGRKIRNEFKLWDYPWTPEIDCSSLADCSPGHPDQISFEVIKEVWKLVHKTN